MYIYENIEIIAFDCRKVTLMKAKKKKALAQQDESPLIGEKVEAVTTHFK